MEDNNTICPLMSSDDGLRSCVKEKCQWWHTYYKDTEYEYSCCVIENLSGLTDIVSTEVNRC